MVLNYKDSYVFDNYTNVIFFFFNSMYRAG